MGRRPKANPEDRWIKFTPQQNRELHEFWNDIRAALLLDPLYSDERVKAAERKARKLRKEERKRDCLDLHTYPDWSER